MWLVPTTSRSCLLVLWPVSYAPASSCVAQQPDPILQFKAYVHRCCLAKLWMHQKVTTWRRRRKCALRARLAGLLSFLLRGDRQYRRGCWFKQLCQFGVDYCRKTADWAKINLFLNTFDHKCEIISYKYLGPSYQASHLCLHTTVMTDFCSRFSNRTVTLSDSSGRAV
jgi:hypothetical protein